MASTSPKFSLNWQDAVEGFLVAALSPILLVIVKSLAAGQFNINWTEEWHMAASAGAAYLLHNFFTGTAPITPPPGPSAIKMLVLLGALTFLAQSGRAQLSFSNPFAPVKKSTFSRFSRNVPSPASVNTFKVSVSLPGYWYSGSNEQRAVVGLGYAFEHYVADTLLYSVGPYVWYDTPIPTGNTKLPIGYGIAGTYKGLILVGILTPDAVHWGPVLSLNFSFGNGGISL